MAVTVDRRLFLADDNETLVEADDPSAAFLWAAEGAEVTDEEAKRVGYKPAGKKSKSATEDKAQDAPTSDKSSRKSSAKSKK